MKSGPEPIFIMSTPRHRRPRTFLPLTMLLLLLVVIFGAIKILPLGPTGGLSQRHTRRLLNDAANFESQSLFQNAIELYQQVCDNPRARAALRAQAALRLASIYTDHIKDPRAAELALEKAYFHTPEGRDKTAIGQRLADLRGVPLYLVAKRDKADKTANASGAGAFHSAHLIAQIGGEAVLLEDVLYAWSRFHGSQPPEGEPFEAFVRWYLDAALMADEARRQGLDGLNRETLDYRLKRVIHLNQALTRKMLNEIKAPTAEELDVFSQRLSTQHPTSIKVGQIVVRNRVVADEVGRELGAGADFQAVADAYSMDKARLQDGYLIGDIRPEDTVIPYLGEAPGLGYRLAAYADGTTTGPIRTVNGYHWIKVLQHSVKAQDEGPKPAEEELLLQYQNQIIARRRQELIRQLRAQTPVEISHQTLEQARKIQIEDLYTTPTPKTSALPVGRPAIHEEPATAPLQP